MLIVLIKPTESAIPLERLNLEIGVVDMWIMTEPMDGPSGERFNAVVSYRSRDFTESVILECGYNIVSVMMRIDPAS